MQIPTIGNIKVVKVPTHIPAILKEYTRDVQTITPTLLRKVLKCQQNLDQSFTRYMYSWILLDTNTVIYSNKLDSPQVNPWKEICFKRFMSFCRHQLLLLLSYVLKDQEFNDLDGIPLLPLADGTFTEFKTR